jgi:hypothetical protein
MGRQVPIFFFSSRLCAFAGDILKAADAAGAMNRALTG